jgi:hypothetical protein
MNAKKVKALRKTVGFKPHEKREYEKDGKTLRAKGLRRHYQQEKKYATT